MTKTQNTENIRLLLPSEGESASMSEDIFSAHIFAYMPDCRYIVGRQRGREPYISGRQISELRNHASLYTDQLMLFESEGHPYIATPSLYPSCGILPVFELKISPRVARRLICSLVASGEAVVSRHFDIRPARWCKETAAFERDLNELAARMSAALGSLNTDADKMSGEGRRNFVVEQFFKIAKLASVDVKLYADADICDGNDFPRVDVQLLSAFLYTMLLSASKNSPDKCVELYFCRLSDSLLVQVEFELLRGADTAAEIFAWEQIAYGKNMLFEYNRTETGLRVKFNPFRADWSYLGLKQHSAMGTDGAVRHRRFRAKK